MSTKTISELQVGDVVVSVWGTVLASPATITVVDISKTYGGGVVRHDGGGIWPVRANDSRPVVVR